MVCLDGNGSFSHLSMRHEPDVFNIPMMFAALHIVSGEGKSMTRVLQGPAQKQRIFGMTGTGNGGRGSALGLPHFGTARFRDRFPFGTVELEDEGIPVSVRITGFSPFVPLDADSSSLPVAGLEYEFVNNRQETISATFSFNAENFIKTSAENANPTNNPSV